MTDAVSPAGDLESAKILAIVASIPLAVDLGRYDLAQAAFAPEIVIDYTSLWGGEPQRTTPAALMEAWRGLVPGFDATRHELFDLEARIDGDTATATAGVDGRHWIGDALWRPIGTYHWTLARRDGRWEVTAMTFALTREIGDRALVAIAAERAGRG
ncbi:SnoaL-like protein [Roseiarcus fermentans]|uniref:SnoaL-like protein n=1 Tax=Roseiarcus fermentans TaxID=1473586 RepID=A0A366FHP0_9HYPH|nr:nuclear transport factor 2 family protein [Roseiarcus fermentans]RBP14121.1 SnoaL-like protein [Roseiarcus fermentans]